MASNLREKLDNGQISRDEYVALRDAEIAERKPWGLGGTHSGVPVTTDSAAGFTAGKRPNMPHGPRRIPR
ncbi:MAG: hypothetical protein WC773_02750 [Patescibacteria group bacterium]|jgi:hypothetical protein